MSRPWIFGIICLCLFASTASVGWGQDYLDLPEEPPASNGPTLTDRFKSITGKFGRKAKPSKARSSKSKSSQQRSNPRPPRYQKSKSRSQRSSSPAVSSQTQRTASKQQQSSRSVSSNRKPSGIASRPNSNDLLPDTNLFSRSRQSQYQPKASKPQQQSRQIERIASQPRAGSSKNQPAVVPKRVTRKSPVSSRANELDAALADLLHTKSPRKKRVALIRSAKRTSPIASNSFDLRKALLDDEEDSLAAEVAEAAEAAMKPKVAAPKIVAAPVIKQPKVIRQPKAMPAPVVASKPVEAVVEADPAAVAEPEVVEPTVIEPTVIEPTVIEPKVIEPNGIEQLILEPIVETKPTKPAITIAVPRAVPTFSSDRSSTSLSAQSTAKSSTLQNDPFENEAKQSFSTSQPSNQMSSKPSGNPMRAFQSVVEPTQPAKTIARPQNGVLQTSQQPVIVSHVEGPKSIIVGREATFQVTLENTSSTTATDLSAQISVPEWAELVDAMSTSGVVERSSQGADAGVLEWKLRELAPRASQALRLRLIPRSGRPLQLGVRWSQAPVETQAIIEVQEPKLELAISGPKEVRYGKAQRYRLTLRNPGTGLTEQVSLRLIPPGGDAQSATTQKIGSLKPGEVRDIDLELTAREAGELLIQADATADGGLHAETTKTVLCRKPELKIDWRGPEEKYAGTVAAYYFRVSNPGTAATEAVAMSVKLPAGTEFISASEGYSINAATGVVSWQLGAINTSEEQFMQIRCKIARPGMNGFKLIAKTSDGELTDSKDFQTNVIALADLKLEVSDPQGPLPMGESVAYEIRVRNRGTTNAENINVIGLFSDGIDPTTVEGAQFSLRDGRVSFHPIKSLPAGREILLRINAKANRVGTHVFRTEVTCPELDIKLAAEETTRFFEDEYRWEDGETPYTAERQSTTTR